MSIFSAALPARLAAILVAALVLVGLGPFAAVPAHAELRSIPRSNPTVSTATDLEEFEVQLMNQINQVRTASGLKKIGHFDTCVDRMAESWAERLASTGDFEHRNQRQVLRRCDQRWAGENLVRGVLLTPELTVEAWLDSPAHREILMKGRARLAGVAVRLDSRGQYVGVLNVTDPD